ncbi:DUF1345 domain-containing protein [Paracoccus aminophilus]|uniref:Transmembrane protein n=1 Tax=Paracoccus aminophilus JCM 7686 TaxID=1367847 RepID=S5YC70_PARAH|nr:DUF1345 domain-containing protein [Paracoccus aminophilus]AGT09033.1 hypothetical protein JCM7686_1932 [Paracoccus aminophilus JCM 7686]
MIADLRHHLVFLITFALGLVAGGLAFGLALHDRVLIAADVFFATYLIAAYQKGQRLGTKGWRRHGDDQDEGMVLIVCLALGSVVVSITAILMAMKAPAGHLGPIRPVLGLLSVPLGWTMVHLMLAFHYAGLWYAQTDDGKDAGGLEFPGGPAEPQFWDFIYYSFTLGMTAQTSDIAVKTTHLRRITVLHGALSFFYNTVIVALAVNAAVSLGQ